MSFTVGEQPCATYEPQMEVNVYAAWANEHECFGPYPVEAGADRCRGRVSFCSNCNRDHHSGGWDACGRPTPSEERP